MHYDKHKEVSTDSAWRDSVRVLLLESVTQEKIAGFGYTRGYARIDDVKYLPLISDGSKCKADKIMFLYYSYTVYSATQTAAILGEGNMLAFASRLLGGKLKVKSNAKRLTPCPYRYTYS